MGALKRERSGEREPLGRPSWIAFDFMDTVLVDPWYELLKKDAAFARIVREGLNNYEAWKLFELGRCTEAEYLRSFYVVGKLEGWPDPLEIKAHIDGGGRFVPGMEALLQRLKGSGSHLLLHSNYPCWFAGIRDRFSLSEIFDRFVISHEVGVRKPDAGFYEEILAACGASAGECIFVDDRETNVDGAMEAGFHGVLFRGAAGLQSHLAEKGCLPPG